MVSLYINPYFNTFFFENLSVGKFITCTESYLYIYIYDLVELWPHNKKQKPSRYKPYSIIFHQKCIPGYKESGNPRPTYKIPDLKTCTISIHEFITMKKTALIAYYIKNEVTKKGRSIILRPQYVY